MHNSADPRPATHPSNGTSAGVRRLGPAAMCGRHGPSRRGHPVSKPAFGLAALNRMAFFTLPATFLTLYRITRP